MDKEEMAKVLARCKRSIDKVTDELGKVIIGQKTVIKQILGVVFARGHGLVVGVPGLAKTLMVSSISKTLALTFRRIQFTPDLMPSDIIGTNIIDESGETGRREFRFVQGPVFANVILADEINRTPPKTQSALLEAMQERQVTVGQTTYALPDPFFVIATQNPIEMEGTYPLPEAQLDRFMFNINIDYPKPDEEEMILVETTRGATPELETVIGAKEIIGIQRVVQSIPVPSFIAKYVTKLIRMTRPQDPTSPNFVREMVDWGAGPRAGQYLLLGAKAFAVMDGRFNIAIDDIKAMAVPVLRHRVYTNFRAQAEGIDSVEVTRRLLKLASEPPVAKYA